MSRRGDRARKLVLPAVGLAAAAFAVARLGSGRRRPGAAYLAGAPLLIAHRGGAQLAPENTLIAFERALNWWGADILELDVHPSRDGEAVVIHDATLDRTTDGQGAVIVHSARELGELDAGYRFTADGGMTHPFRGRKIGVPTLAEVLAAFPRARLNIEIKNGLVQDRVWECVREAGAAHRVLIAAGRSRDSRRLRDKPVAVSAGKEELRAFIVQLRLGAILHTPAVDAFQVPDWWEGREIATRELIDAARARNIPVHVWTVNEAADMRRFLDWGADGLVTDRPDRLARILFDRIGRPLPPGPPDPLPESFLERLLRD